MKLFKSSLFGICKEIASEFDGWDFSSGMFRNKSLKFAELRLCLGLSFQGGDTCIQPSVHVLHKESMRLFKELLSYEQDTSFINFQEIYDALEYVPVKLRKGFSIYESKEARLAVANLLKLSDIKERLVDLEKAADVLRMVLKDGISAFDRYYNFSSENDFLKNLPPKYAVTADRSVYAEMELQKGVMLCVTRILLGDFDFVKKYRSDDYKTIYPKRISDLDKIIAAFPMLEKRYSLS